jgi:hypothetical protein
MQLRSLQGRGTVTLPGTYIQEHVSLAYAVTVHRSQGITVDQAVLVVDRAASREHLYVGMTRGRQHNLAYVVTEPTGDEHSRRPVPTAQEVLATALRRTSAEKSATETLRDELQELGPPGAAIIEGLRQAQHHSYQQTVREQAKRRASPASIQSSAPTLTHSGPDL